MSEESQKLRKKCEKIAKSDPTWPNNPSLDGIRETLSLLRKELKPSVTYENPLK